MKVMITGGAGFIGSHVADACLAAGHETIIVDDLSTGKRENVPADARLYEVDIRDEAALDEVFRQERPEAISHQAAKANVRESMEKPLVYADVNIMGSLTLLEAARRYGCRKIVYASTGGAVYGEPEYLPVDEDHPINPLDPYGASKHHVEHYLRIYSTHFSIDHTILRYPNVYGPRQDPFGEAGVVAIFAAQMLRDIPPIINGSGEQQRDFCYVGDIARANVLALTRGSGEIINLGSGVGTSVNQIFDMLAAACGNQIEKKYGPAKLGEVFCTYLDGSKAQEVLGWEAQVPLKEGLQATLDSFRAKILNDAPSASASCC
jgi:UDP-glucose 4-epimerase